MFQNHRRVIVILPKTISLIKSDRLRVRGNNLDIKQIFEIFQNSFHQFIADMMSLIGRIDQKIVQKRNGFPITKRSYQADQFISIPCGNDIIRVLHRPDKLIRVIP